MTHLSPFSYPQRLSIFGCAFVMMILISNLMSYSYLENIRHRRFDLKFACYTLLGVHCVTWMVYDFTTWINSYYLNNVTGLGLASDTTSLRVRYFCDGLLDLAFTSHTSMLFLLISFWHTLFKSETARHFISEWEFKAYIVYSVFSVVLYPSFQWGLFNEDPRLPVAVPQLIYFAEIMLTSVLFLMVVVRMKKFCRMQEQANNRTSPLNSGINGGLNKNQRAVMLIQLLCKLIYLLIIANLLIACSLTTLNIVYLSYSTTPEAHAAITLGVWDFVTGVFSISFLPMIVLTTIILNVGALSRMLKIPVTTTGALSSSSHTGGEAAMSTDSQSDSRTDPTASV